MKLQTASNDTSIGGAIGGWWAGLMTSFFDGLYSNKLLLVLPFAAGVVLAIMLKLL